MVAVKKVHALFTLPNHRFLNASGIFPEIFLRGEIAARCRSFHHQTHRSDDELVLLFTIFELSTRMADIKHQTQRANNKHFSSRRTFSQLELGSRNGKSPCEIGHASGSMVIWCYFTVPVPVPVHTHARTHTHTHTHTRAHTHTHNIILYMHIYM